jgi:hypothetical protein
VDQSNSNADNFINRSIKTLLDHKARQIDENRIISRRVDDLEAMLKDLDEKITRICG